MKKSIILSLAIVIISAAAANAQGFQFGVKGGLNIFKIEDQGGTFSEVLKNNYKYGFNVGGYATFNFSKHIGIQPEILWNEYHGNTNDYATYDNLWTDRDISLNYLSIPILLNLSPTKLITFQVGPQFGILINQSQTFATNSEDAFKKGDFSMVGGIQLNLKWLKLGGRYVIGLNNISDVANTNQWKSQGFQVFAGVKII
jgi:hypothetical protein